MTTEELIKALREKPSRDNRKFLDEVADCVEMLQNALFALNEEWTAQRIEIKEQASLILSLSNIKTTVINEAKAEAVKEFAERLKERMFNYYECVSESAKGRPYKGDTLMDYEVVDMIEDSIDNLVKEFTEEQK